MQQIDPVQSWALWPAAPRKKSTKLPLPGPKGSLPPLADEEPQSDEVEQEPEDSGGLSGKLQAAQDLLHLQHHWELKKK